MCCSVEPLSVVGSNDENIGMDEATVLVLASEVILQASQRRIGKARTAASIQKLRRLGYRIFSVSKTGREVGFLLSSETQT